MPASTDPIATRRVGDLRVLIFDREGDLGAHATAELVPLLDAAVALRGHASIIVAAANSQLQFMRALRERGDVEWDKVHVFHMDEYAGLPPDHPASLRSFIRRNLTDVVRPRAFFGIEADAPDVEGELRRYADLLSEYPPDVTVMGVGENGHLAFNDPPADFHTDKVIQQVTLDEGSRRQQVGEGHFATVDDVPKHALSLTIPALLSARDAFVIVPEMRKARAVKAALEGPVEPNCPASILQRQPHARMYLDRDSASLLK